MDKYSSGIQENAKMHLKATSQFPSANNDPKLPYWKQNPTS